MTPLTHLPDNRVMCPQCASGFRLERPGGSHTKGMCEVPGCKRLYKIQTPKRGPIRVYIDPVDMEAGRA